MKRLLTILCAFAFACCTLPSYGQIYFQEDFQSGMGNWISIDNDGYTVNSQNGMITSTMGVTKLGWGVYSDPQSTSKFAMSTSWYSSPSQSDDWLISPEIQVGSNAFLEWQAVGFDSQFPDGYEVYLSESGAEMSDFSTLLLQVAKENSSWYPRSIDLSAYNGKTVRIAFRNNSTDMFNLGIDNIIVSTPEYSDEAVALGTILPEFLQKDAGLDIDLYIKNSGRNPITSVEINYQATGEGVHTATLSGLNLTYVQMVKLTHTEKWIPETTGKKTIAIWISKVNGIDVDINADYHKTDANIIVYDDNNSASWATPLIEEFTASTCPPCASLNSTFNPLIETNKENITIVKYQMNWPGNGDPYYNDDGGTRRTYYGVTGVPDVYFVGGEPNGQPNSQAAFNALFLERAFFGLSATYSINGNEVMVDANITALSDMFKTNQVKAYIAVIENKTTGNIGTNGETEFHYVMQKMLPNGAGRTILPLDAGQSQFINNSAYTFTTTDHVEEMSDLSVVVFLQDVASKRILASVWATYDENTPTYNGPSTADVKDNSGNGIVGLFPNPAVDNARVRYSVVGQQDVNIALFNMNGEEIISINRNNLTDGVYFEDLNTKELSSGSYLVKLTIGGKTHTRTINVVK